jgi:hypothetical protein
MKFMRCCTKTFLSSFAYHGKPKNNPGYFRNCKFKLVLIEIFMWNLEHMNCEEEIWFPVVSTSSFVLESAIVCNSTCFCAVVYSVMHKEKYLQFVYTQPFLLCIHLLAAAFMTSCHHSYLMDILCAVICPHSQICYFLSSS